MLALQSLPDRPQQAVLVVAVLLVLAGVLRRSDSEFGRRRRQRLLLGLPVGTLVMVGIVLAVYLFVQGAWRDIYDPVVIPFRAWSFYYPTGLLLAGLSHASLGHITGNLIGTLAVGSLAEYAWGHYPTTRGSGTFTSWRTNPYARVAVFVAGSLVVAVLTGVFALGPVIGFSAVVFAYAGYALARYPLGTLVAVLAGRVLSLVWNALRTPAFTTGGSEQFVTPWWADVAIQGHALGLFIGFLLGAAVVRSRDERPDALRVFAGVLLYAVSQGLWAVYAPASGNQFTLFQAVGAALVFVLAALFAWAVVATDRPLVGTVRAAGREVVVNLRSREVAVGLVMAVLVALAGTAIPYNLFVVADADAGVTADNSLTVRDYTVFYTEDVPNQYIASVQIGALSGASQVNASGVVVVSRERNIWWQTVSSGRLAAQGRASVEVGGVGWQDRVVVNRTDWRVVGNGSVYTVHLEHGETRKLAFTSEPRTAEPRVAGRNVTLLAGDPFTLRVTRANETLGERPLPAVNETVAVGGLRFTRVKDGLFALTADNGTRVRVATFRRD